MTTNDAEVPWCEEGLGDFLNEPVFEQAGADVRGCAGDCGVAVFTGAAIDVVGWRVGMVDLQRASAVVASDQCCQGIWPAGPGCHVSLVLVEANVS